MNSAWRLDLASLQLESRRTLVTARFAHACCAVRGSVAVIGGHKRVGNEVTTTASVEVISSEGGATFMTLPPLSCGRIRGVAAIAVDETDSAAGQVRLHGELDPTHDTLATVQLVDLATSVCTPQLHLRRRRTTAGQSCRLCGRYWRRWG